jgi:hypothetical protein
MPSLTVRYFFHDDNDDVISAIYLQAIRQEIKVRNCFS